MFDIIKDILSKTSNGKLHHKPDFDHAFNKYVIIRYLSMKPELSSVVDFCNMHQARLTNQQMYVYLYQSVPKQRNGFITYIKPKKVDPHVEMD